MASKMSEHTQKSTGSGAVFFDATLHPNRSLGPTGFRILMFVVGVSVLIESFSSSPAPGRFSAFPAPNSSCSTSPSA